MMTFRIGSVVLVVEDTFLIVQDEKGQELGKRSMPEKANMKIMEACMMGEKLRQQRAKAPKK